MRPQRGCNLQNRNSMLKLFNSIFLFYLTSGLHSVILVSVHGSIPIIIKIEFVQTTNTRAQGEVSYPTLRYGHNSNAKFFAGKYKRRYKIKLVTQVSLGVHWFLFLNPISWGFKTVFKIGTSPQ